MLYIERLLLLYEQAMSFFLGELGDDIQMPVRIFAPKSLRDAYSLVRLQEASLATIAY